MGSVERKMEVKDLTLAQCILLTVHLASESNIQALHSFTPYCTDALKPELVLRILLTYLPEALDPEAYTSYINEVGSHLYIDYKRQDVEVNLSTVQDISDEQAQKQVKKLHLLEFQPPDFPPDAPGDALTRFLCHRACRIDEQTGLLNLIPKLIEPFLERNNYIRMWYLSIALPLLRLSTEYYSEEESTNISLSQLAKLSGREGVDFLLRRASAGQEPEHAADTSEKSSTIGRDIKGLVGPWMWGHTDRKRRKLRHDDDDSQDVSGAASDDVEAVGKRLRKISLSGVTADDQIGHDWEHVYRWIVEHAKEQFSLAANAIEDWDGPSDIDLGDYERGGIRYIDDDDMSKLELQYAQAAFASCYAAVTDTEQTIRNAHSILARLAELLDFIPPPDLATSVESLPKIDKHVTKIDESQTVSDLAPDALLRPEHPLTTPKMETYMLLQMMVYSAYQLSGLGYPFSIVNVAKLHFYSSASEQLEVLRKILASLVKKSTHTGSTWHGDRLRLLWLWNWGITPDEVNKDIEHGPGTLGKIRKQEFEGELAKVFIETNCFQLVSKTYLENENTLSPSQVERIVLGKAMEAYDGASNGNKTRGGVKKANDIIQAFRPHFVKSDRLQRASALIAATHSLSFYSLTLQHGVPFQPVSIRVSQDPISLISKVLEQNPKSYTKLDDLISIAQNLISAGLPQSEDRDNMTEFSAEDLAKRRKDAERRVTFMAIEAALREDDFETAYSYIVSRLTPSGADIEAPNERAKQHKKRASQTKNIPEDDISWRAAFLAGRYRPSSASPPSLRRLEQRTELLSLALLLAPVSALTDILAAWRRCEEETTSLQLSQQQAEQEFDDIADKRQSSALPGNFTITGEQPELVLNQKRREMGRMAGSGGQGTGETPLSMFDLTRNAARAFSKNAFPLREAAATTRTSEEESGRDEIPVQGERLRKRDMVASGLASGLGWVLGATPVSQQQHGQ